MGGATTRPSLIPPSKYRLPAIGEGGGFVDAGLLMTYTMDFAELYERGAEYVYRILLGATPAGRPAR